MNRRDLRRRFGSTPLGPVQGRPTGQPGARFYVVARELSGSRTAPLLGPYASHMTALSHVSRAQRLLTASRYAERGFVSVGTCLAARAVGKTAFGR